MGGDVVRYGLCLFRADAGTLGRQRKSHERSWLRGTTESVPMDISIYKSSSWGGCCGYKRVPKEGAEHGIPMRAPNLHLGIPSLCSAPPGHLQQHSQLHKFKFMC